jgi:elongation factor P--(R)-beta-lysine ligase
MLAKIPLLRDRAAMLARCRAFFQQRGILEVDCPLITEAASVDAHIDLIAVRDRNSWRYLHSSPEYGMKRLIAAGIGDIFQLAHVFREGEQSPKHNPEFTMAEWYRHNISFAQMMQETVEFVQLFLGGLPAEIISYRETFQRYAGLDYVHASVEKLLAYIRQNNLTPYAGIEAEGQDALLNLILGSHIEPQLGKNNTLTVLAYYPHTQAALAKTCMRGDELAAERFEIYYQGVELANGYHELTDPVEQRRRFAEANAHRIKLGKEALPQDEKFLKALEQGLPDCCGVAVGFDRLMMLRHQAQDISQVIPFSWNDA